MIAAMFGKKNPKPSERVYLDWAAATPLLPEAKAAMEPYLIGNFGNPSAIHQEGQIARTAIEEARATIARTVQVKPEYVTFTSGGTEGNNMVIQGVFELSEASRHGYEALRRNGDPECQEPFANRNIITTRIEHPSITETLRILRRRGVEVRYVDVDEQGRIDLAHFRELADLETVLCSIAYINSEIGTIQPVRAIKKILEAQTVHAPLHLDAAQAPLWLNCQLHATAADFLVLDAAKCCGPKGVGILIRSTRAHMLSAIGGGGQESGLRPGTENVVGIVGAAIALEAAQANWRAGARQGRAVRNQAIAYLQEQIPQVVVNGVVPRSDLGTTQHEHVGQNLKEHAVHDDRVANNINISIPGLDTEFATVVLDKHGFAVSTKSACSGAGGGASAVVLETSDDPARAASTLRFSISPETTTEDIQQLTKVLKMHISQMDRLTNQAI